MLAIALAMLSLVRVSADGLTYRQTELSGRARRGSDHAEGLPVGPPARDRIRRSTRAGGSATGDPARRSEPAQQPDRSCTPSSRRATRCAELMRRDGPIQRARSSRRRSSCRTGAYTLPLIDSCRDRDIAARGDQAFAQRGANAFQTYLTRTAAGKQRPEHGSRDRPAGGAAAQRRDLPAPLEDDADRDLPRRDVRDRRSRLPAREPAAARAPRASRGRSGARRHRTASTRIAHVSSFTVPEASSPDDPAGRGRRSPRSCCSRSSVTSGFSLRGAAGVVVLATLVALIASDVHRLAAPARGA